MVADNGYPFYLVDAFAQQPFQGNPAAVVPQAEGLTDVQMQHIAREANCSETAFVLHPTQAAADLRLRWFTPTLEVNLCGHATIATLHVLAQEGRFNLQRGTTQILYLETRSGLLKVLVDCRGERPWIWLTLPSCQFERLSSALIQELTVALGESEMNAPTAVVDSHNHDVLIAATHLHQLHGLAPDMPSLAKLGKREGWRGVCVYTTETIASEADAHLRFFAPQSGILEDPVTGSVSGPLALYLSQTKATSPEGKPQAEPQTIWHFEQGDCLGRAGRLTIELDGQNPKLGGQAVTVLRGELHL
jgi:trans-2,3-dihydro-3-hydroxyanthranilate isomerase